MPVLRQHVWINDGGLFGWYIRKSSLPFLKHGRFITLSIFVVLVLSSWDLSTCKKNQPSFLWNFMNLLFLNTDQTQTNQENLLRFGRSIHYVIPEILQTSYFGYFGHSWAFKIQVSFQSSIGVWPDSKKSMKKQSNIQQKHYILLPYVL